MKSIPAGLLAKYASGSTTICACLLVERKDGVVNAFTSADRNVVLDGYEPGADLLAATYEAATGLDISSLVSQATLAVDNMELTVLPDEVSYPQVDILAGRWDGAKFRLFEVDYTDTDAGVNLLKRGTTGEADVLRSTNRFEFRGLKQALQTQLGRVTSKTCPYRLGQVNADGTGCLIDLSLFTFTYTVTGVTSRRVFTCSAAVEADDYYKNGIALSTDMLNDGYERKIKSFAAGVVTLMLPMPFEIQIGDTFDLTAGCQQRLEEDCRDKFDNVLNFGGEPHLVGPDALTASPSGL